MLNICCPHCNEKFKTTICYFCREKIIFSAKVCKNCGKVPRYMPTLAPHKSELIYTLLLIFTGYLGLHNFYAGLYRKALSQLIMSILSCGVFSIFFCMEDLEYLDYYWYRKKRKKKTILISLLCIFAYLIPLLYTYIYISSVDHVVRNYLFPPPYYERIVNDKNIEDKVEFWTKASKQKNIEALCNLACFRFDRGNTVKNDYRESNKMIKIVLNHNAGKTVIYLEKLANKGSILAQIELARCYKNGVGVKKDLKKALEWYSKANKQREMNCTIKSL